MQLQECEAAAGKDLVGELRQRVQELEDEAAVQVEGGVGRLLRSMHTSAYLQSVPCSL